MPEIEIAETTGPWPMELLLDADPAEDVVREYLRDGTTFVAHSGEETVGVLVLLRTRPRTMEIMNVSVGEPWRRRGIATSLIHRAVAYAREAGAETLEIGTGNPGAMQMLLYQKCGFRIVGIDFDYFRKHLSEPVYENGIECRDMIRMRMEL